MVLIALALVAAGCGGGGGESGSTHGAQATGPAQTSTGGSAPASPVTPTKPQPAVSPTGRPAPSGERALSAADAICARRNSELTAVHASFGSMPALVAAARDRAKIEVRALGELEKLTPPAALVAPYRRLTALDGAALLQVVKAGERAQAGDAAGARLAKARASRGTLRLLIAATGAHLRSCSGIPGFE